MTCGGQTARNAATTARSCGVVRLAPDHIGSVISWPSKSVKTGMCPRWLILPIMRSRVTIVKRATAGIGTDPVGVAYAIAFGRFHVCHATVFASTVTEVRLMARKPRTAPITQARTPESLRQRARAERLDELDHAVAERSRTDLHRGSQYVGVGRESGFRRPCHQYR